MEFHRKGNFFTIKLVNLYKYNRKALKTNNYHIKKKIMDFST